MKSKEFLKSLEEYLEEIRKEQPYGEREQFANTCVETALEEVIDKAKKLLKD